MFFATPAGRSNCDSASSLVIDLAGVQGLPCGATLFDRTVLEEVRTAAPTNLAVRTRFSCAVDLLHKYLFIPTATGPVRISWAVRIGLPR